MTCLALLLLVPGIGSDLWDRDEAEYAEVAREIVSSGNWSDPTLFGKPYSEKPPLGIWLTAGSFEVLGESSLSARLPHVLAAALACAVLFALGTSIAGDSAAAAAAILLPTALLFLASARLLLMDSLLLLVDLLAVLAIERMRSLWHPGWVPVAGLATGLALLAKGPIGYAPPVLFACGAILASREDRTRLLLGSAGALLLGTLSALPWYLHGFRAGTLSSFFLREHLFRFTHAMEGHRGTLLMPWGVLLFGVFPWTAALPRLFRRSGAPPSPAIVGLRVWALGILLAFSFSRTFLPHYVLLALPPTALLVAVAGPPTSRLEWRVAAWITAGVASAIFLAGVFGMRRAAFPDLVVPAIGVLGGVALLTLALPLIPVRFAASRNPLGACVLAALALALALPAVIAPARGLAALGRSTRLNRQAGEPVGGLSLREPSLRYYAGATLMDGWSSPAAILESVRTSGTRSALVWLTDRESVALARSRIAKVQVLASAVNTIESGPQGGIELCRVRLLYRY